MPLWLGLDLSTQSLTGAVLGGDGVGAEFNEPVVLESVNFEVGFEKMHEGKKAADGCAMFHTQGTEYLLGMVPLPSVCCWRPSAIVI